MISKSAVVSGALGYVAGVFLLAVITQLIPQANPASVASNLPTLTGAKS